MAMGDCDCNSIISDYYYTIYYKEQRGRDVEVDGDLVELLLIDM